MTNENIPTILGVTFVMALLSLVLNVFAITRGGTTELVAATAGNQNVTELLGKIAAANTRIDGLEKQVAEAKAAAAAPPVEAAPVEAAAAK